MTLRKIVIQIIAFIDFNRNNNYHAELHGIAHTKSMPLDLSICQLSIDTVHPAEHYFHR